MAQIKAYGKRILTLTAESELITHKQEFRDSRRGNRQLKQVMIALKNLNNHNNSASTRKHEFYKYSTDFKSKVFRDLGILPQNKLKVTITKS